MRERNSLMDVSHRDLVKADMEEHRLRLSIDRGRTKGDMLRHIPMHVSRAGQVHRTEERVM
jgi:hypothetical protein